MCGFIGIISDTKLSEEQKNSVPKMLDLISHRGPDAKNTLISENCALGFCRLSIVDLEGGDQPYVYGDVYVVFNGEIYNYISLRDELMREGESFDTRSEVEVIAHLYKKYGSSFVSRLRGMFSVIVYDKQKNIAVAARDMFGIKPLYYYESGSVTIFASEMKAFAECSDYDKFKVSKPLLQHYMTFQYVTEPDTITGDIKILPTGSYMTVSGNSREITRYYKPIFSPKKNISYDEKKKMLRNAVYDSVSRHLQSDTPIGAFLSSGIDSAIVTAIASEYKPGIKAFTVGFDVKGYSELENAAKIAEKINVEHIQVKATLDDFVKNYEKVIYHLDSPVADPSVVAIYLVSKEAAKHVKAVVTGEGSDELFGGYRIYDTAKSLVSTLPDFAKKGILSFAKKLPDSVKGKNYLIRGLTPISERFVGNSFVFSEEKKKAVLKTYDESIKYTDRTHFIFDEVKSQSPLLQMQYCDVNTWLKSDILVKGDRLSMANSLEARVPFLDKEVFKVASTFCDRDKINKGTTKYILRDTFSDLLDRDTVLRPKLGYPVPVRIWLKDELYDWATDIIKNSTAEEYINSSEALKLLELHRTGKADLYHQIWVILTFITWYRLYIDGDYRKLIESR